MTIFHVEVDDKVATAIRVKAESGGKTPEQYVAAMCEAEAGAATGKEWLREFLESAKKSSGNATGWKWNRAELYDR